MRMKNTCFLKKETMFFIVVLQKKKTKQKNPLAFIHNIQCVYLKFFHNPTVCYKTKISPKRVMWVQSFYLFAKLGMTFIIKKKIITINIHQLSLMFSSLVTNLFYNAFSTDIGLHAYIYKI